jgi:hypothetical protein
MSRPFTEQLKEGQAIAGVTATPGGQTLNNSSVVTSAIDMSIMRRARAFLFTSTLTSTASLNFGLQASATEAGSYADITLTTTAVQITAIVTDNSFNAIEIRADQMPAGKPWLIAKVTETASQNAVCCVFIVADCAAYSPGNQADSVTWTNNVVGSSQAS